MGRPKSDNKKKRICVSIDPQKHELFAKLCKQGKICVSTAIEMLIDDTIKAYVRPAN
jgi:orotidine-5'-phosphate decarboxylase